jgi:hypothetical protein
MFLRGRNSVVAVDAATVVTVDATIDAASDAAIDAMPDAAEIDAALIDAGGKPKLDASIAVAPVDAAPRPAGNGTLKIGAIPWGEVVIDGVAKGRTPFETTLSAGKHTIEVIYKGEDPPRTHKQTIDLANGETETVVADFSKP